MPPYAIERHAPDARVCAGELYWIRAVSHLTVASSTKASASCTSRCRVNSSPRAAHRTFAA